MRKATHKGTCQWCGAQQKLPAGRLSQHGYTLRWGFFSGVCHGSGCLPFEQSCDLIKGAIDWAQKRIVTLEASAEELRRPATEAKAFVADYGLAARDGRPRYCKLEVGCEFAFEVRGRQYYHYFFIDSEQRSRRLNLYSHLPQSALELATVLNTQYADTFGREVRELEKYIQWQSERIFAWEPAELTEAK
jgi:hypothetical protein